MLYKSPLRVAILGTGSRAVSVYGPLMKNFPVDIELVAVWGRSPEPTKRLSHDLGIPGFTDLDQLIRATSPDIGIVCVNYHANGEVGLMAVQAGLHVLLETPIAHKLSEADAIITAAKERNLKVEIAEQFHRRPLEQIKLKIIESGILGRVHSSFNDFAGHGYHGISILRSYLGFDVSPVQVTGAIKRYDLAPHWARLGDVRSSRVETQEHGMIEFESGQLGIFHWTDVGYDSALRWWRSSRFLGEKGMGITIGFNLETKEYISRLASDGEAPQFIFLERRLERVDGGALVAMIAHTGDLDQPVIRWDNPFYQSGQGPSLQWHDDEIGIGGCLLSLVRAIQNDIEPTYGSYQGRLDQELILALRLSAMNNSQPIKLPLDTASVENLL